MFEPYFSITLAFLAALCWGANAHIVKRGMIGENPYYALFIRSLSTVPILSLIVLILKGIDGILIYFNPELLGLAFLSSILIVLGDGMFLYSMKRFTVSVVMPLTSIYPLFTVLILIATGTEQIGIFILLGTILIIFGISVVTSGDLSNTFRPIAIVFGLITAGFWGSSIYFVRIILSHPGTDAMGLTAVRSMYIGIIGAMIFFSNPHNRKIHAQRSKDEKMNSIKFFLISGIVGWVLGASLFFIAVQNIGAAIPTPISSTNPIIASIIGAKLGLEEVSKKQYLGITMSVIGLIIILL